MTEPISRIDRVLPVPIEMPVLRHQTDPVYDLPFIDTALDQEIQRPELEPPSSYQLSPFQDLIVKFVESLTSIESNYLDTIDIRLKDTCQAYNRDQKQMLEEERNIEKKLEAETWYTFVQRVALCLLGAVSLIASTSLLGAATTAWEVGAAIALMTSSASSIVGATLLDTHPQATTVLTAASAAMSLIGGMHLALFSTQTVMELTGKIVMSTLGVMGNFAGLSREALSSEIEQLKASHALVNGSFENYGIQMQNLEKDLGFFSERISDNVKTCAMIQYKKEQSLRKILVDIGPA